MSFAWFENELLHINVNATCSDALRMFFCVCVCVCFRVYFSKMCKRVVLIHHSLLVVYRVGLLNKENNKEHCASINSFNMNKNDNKKLTNWRASMEK